MVFGGGANATSNGSTINANGGTVTITNTTLTQASTAILEANGAGSTVTLTSATITGGTLSTSAGGLIETGDSNSVLSALTNAGTVQVTDGTNLTLQGAIANSGAINVNGATSFTGLLIGATAVTLSGGGQVSLVHDGYIAGAAAGASLTNVDNTISGAGFIRGPLALTNEAAGVINANGGNLTLNNGDTITNDGLVEATGTGVLVVRGSSIDSSGGGTVEAGNGARIQVTGATLTGGTLTVAAGGELQTATAASTIGAGISVANAGTIQITNGAALTVADNIDNRGVIQINGAATFTGLVVAAGGMTLTGGGQVIMEPKGYITGYGAGASLTNFDNTIEGGGFIKSPLTITNDAAGTINANHGNMLVNTGNTITNDGLVEATATGILILRNTSVDSSGGGHVVDSRQIQLDNSTLTGGSLSVDAGGKLVSGKQGGTVSLGGATVTNAGLIQGDLAGLTVNGDVTNTGVIEGNNGALTITGAVTGTGTALVFGKGSLEVDGAFSQNVRFAAGSTGSLIVSDFTGAVFGLSHTGTNQIDLKNLAFDSSDTTSYSGTATSGTLSILNSSSCRGGDDQPGRRLQGQHLHPERRRLPSGTVVKDPTATTTNSLVSAMAELRFQRRPFRRPGDGSHPGLRT